MGAGSRGEWDGDHSVEITCKLFHAARNPTEASFSGFAKAGIVKSRLSAWTRMRCWIVLWMRIFVPREEGKLGEQQRLLPPLRVKPTNSSIPSWSLA